MITKHLTSLTATFNPLSPLSSHRIPRLLLSFIPPAARLKISTTILPSSSTTPSEVVLGFRDGKVLRFVELSGRGRRKGKELQGGDGVLDLGRLGIKDVVEEVDRHSRALQRQAELSGN